jgi:DNA topoisomerase I
MDYHFTASVEDQLDEVSHGQRPWRGMLKVFYDGFMPVINRSKTEAERVVQLVGRACPKCAKDLVFKYSKSGKFISCSAYPECSYTESYVDPAKRGKLAELEARYNGAPCEAGGTIVVKMGRFGPFLASSLYPEVKWIGKIPDPTTVALEEAYGGTTCPTCEQGIKSKKITPRILPRV